VRQDGEVRHAYDAPARVAPHLAEGKKLLQVPGLQADARFGPQFAQRRLMQFLARLHEAARQCPGLGVGQLAALHQQHPQLARVHGEGRHVHRQPDLGGLRGKGQERHPGDARVGVRPTSRE